MNPKVLIGLLAVVILAFLGYTQSAALGVLILVIGAAAVILVVQRTGDGGGKKKVNDFSAPGGDTGRSGTTTAPAGDESLPTWGGMTAWSGPATTAPDEGYAPTAEPGSGEGMATWESETSWEPDSSESWDSSGDTWGTWSSDTTTADEDVLDLDTEFEQTFGSDYDALGGLDTAEQVDFGSLEPEAAPAEEEPGEPSNVFSFGSAPKPINENVSSADDIMAASAATELHVDEAATENSELAKLLAKVQARLSAYE